MSKIEKLIQELCPNGIEYIRLGEICGRNKKSEFSAKKIKDLKKKGNIYATVSGDYQRNVATDEFLVDDENLFINDGGQFMVKYHKGKAIYSDHVISIFGKKDLSNTKYIYYLLYSKANEISDLYTGTGVKNISIKKLFNLIIPVPPLSVQEEIVKILDSFTELTAELTAELTFRKKQFEYYRENLIKTKCIKNVEYIPIKELCSITRGRVISKKDIEDSLEKLYPVYSSASLNDGEIGKISTFDYEGEYITWTTDGAYAGTIFKRIGKFNITNVCGLLKPLDESKLSTHYLMFALGLVSKKFVKPGSGNPKLMSNVIENIKIPVPPLSVQEEIVKILDQFDSLCNDISAGLPAEIKMRQQQYEYYRDKLLTFKKLDEEK